MGDSPNSREDRDRRTPLWRRLAWFVGLWALGVAAVALCGLVFRVWLKA